MVRYAALSMIVVSAIGCHSDPPPAPAPVAVPADAAIDGITMIGAYDPNSGAQGDDIDPSMPMPTRTNKRTGRPVEIMLRSTPNGAKVSVDSIEVGSTPMTWSGETGEHAFAFRHAGHAFTQYKFLVVQTGTLHARLEPASNDIDAGVAPAHLVEQPISITPPETLIVKPDAALPVLPEDAAQAVPWPVDATLAPSSTDAAPL